MLQKGKRALLGLPPSPLPMQRRRQQRLRIGLLRMAKHRFGGAAFHDHAVFHHQHAVAHGAHHF
jgi:hypothetical protein